MSHEIAQRQESLYTFPYHYLATIERNALPRITRGLSWGFEYLTYMDVIKEEVRSVIPGDGSMLDVGCGDGYLLNSIGAGLKKHGIDLSARAIAFAKAFSTDTIFEVRDINSLKEEYDVVTCIEVLEHIPDDELNDFLAQIMGRIKSGGHLVVSVPTTVVKLNKKHYRHYDEALLTQQLEARHSLSLVMEKRVYRISLLLTIIIKLLNNRVWTINYAPILKIFWKWHSKHNRIASVNDGAHLVRVYRKSRLQQIGA